MTVKYIIVLKGYLISVKHQTGIWSILQSDLAVKKKKKTNNNNNKKKKKKNNDKNNTRK